MGQQRQGQAWQSSAPCQAGQGWGSEPCRGCHPLPLRWGWALGSLSRCWGEGRCPTFGVQAAPCDWQRGRQPRSQPPHLGNAPAEPGRASVGQGFPHFGPAPSLRCHQAPLTRASGGEGERGWGVVTRSPPSGDALAGLGLTPPHIWGFECSHHSARGHCSPQPWCPMALPRGSSCLGGTYHGHQGLPGLTEQGRRASVWGAGRGRGAGGEAGLAGWGV